MNITVWGAGKFGSYVGGKLIEKHTNAKEPIACWCSFERGDFIGKMLKEKWWIHPWQCYIVEEKDRAENREDVLKKIAVGKVLGEVIDFIAMEQELCRRQYFDFFKYDGRKETFVDAGVYDLGSTLGFIEWCGGNYNWVFAFEPDAVNYKCCEEKCASLEKVSLFQSGLCDKCGNIGFVSGFGGASCIESRERDTYADSEIEVVDLDSAAKGEAVTFIKMEIEGAEEKALLGAKHIIAEQKPKLAICVYHKTEDIVELPALVLSMRPDYKLAFRHYSANSANETVMYAW